jgi:hypothetical protein
MLDIVRADDMFDLMETVRDTAFLRRTDAPTLDPFGDGWWLQGYNRSHYERAHGPVGRLLRRASRLTPQSVKDSLPDAAKRMLQGRM